MSTAREVQLSAAPSFFPSPATLWARLLAVLKAVMKAVMKEEKREEKKAEISMTGKQRPALVAMSAGTPPDCQMMSLPSAGKITAISVAGEPVLARRKVLSSVVFAVAAKRDGAHHTGAAATGSKGRRPGMQSRWKSSDRVTIW